MATTITGTAVTFNDASVQNTGTYTNLFTTQGSSSLWLYGSYPIGHYILIENQSKGSFTSANPLNGWEGFYAAPVVVYGQVFTGPTGASWTQGSGSGTNEAICYQRAVTGGSNTLSGTWKNRGGNLICFLVQRVA